MSVNFKVGIRWTNLAVVSLVMCLIFNLAVAAQNNPNKVLDENDVTALLNQLTDGLGDLVEDEEQINSIVDKWNARGGLEGKTRAEILPLLFADVQAVIKDPATRTKIWRAWNPPVPTATAPKPAATPGPKPAVTPGPAQNSQGLDETAAFDLADDLKRRFAGLMSGRRIPSADIKWTDLNTLTGKTRVEIMRLLFADVQAVITDPSSRTLIWNEWNRPAAPPPQLRAPQPLPQTPTGYLAIVTQGGKDNQLMTENIPLLKWDVTIIDGQKKPIAGARVSIRLTSGATGDNTFHSINGKSVEQGIMLTATTNTAGTCSFSIPWTRNARYELTVANSQGIAFKYIDGRPYDGPMIKDFTWDVRWEASRTLEVDTAEGFAKAHAKEFAEKSAKENADKAAILQVLRAPDDNWSRTGWVLEWAEAAMAINDGFTAPEAEGLRAQFTNSQKTVGALNLLKLALTPASYDLLKKLNTFVQSSPRSNESAVVTADIGGKNVDLTVPFRQAPDLKLYQRCKAQTEGSTTPECARALASVIPYQNRWNAINLSCLSNPGLVPVADEFNSLVKTQILFRSGLIKDDYPLFPGTEISKNDYGPPDSRGWICSALVKIEMAKDMARDGFPTAIIDRVVGEELAEEWPSITSANIGGKVEKASDQDALMNWFRTKNQVAKANNIGSVKRLKEDEPKESFRPRVEAMLKNTVDPASGRRLDDSLFIFRVKSLSGRDPAKELVTMDLFLQRGSVHFYDSYDNNADLSPEESLSGYITFKGNTRPGQPVPDKRDLAIAAYGWTIGAEESKESTGPHLGLVVRRWVMYNIHTGEIYGTSEKNGDGKNYGQLFRLDH